jgi:aerobic-type carbon monoxide dehydrogenase small subunit (CoxS/CutS family)
LAQELGLPEGSNVPVAELFQKKYKMQAGNIIGVGSYIPAYAPPDNATGQTPNATPFWMVGAAGAEVEVDTETGHVRVTRLVNVADAGRPINPKVVETQLSGAAVMQFGFTMQEKMEFDGGQVTNASLADYKIPSMLDIPLMSNEAVEAEQKSGPFGAKGVGETATFAVSPAIANAIDDAVGVRLMSLPLTAEAVCRAFGLARYQRLDHCHAQTYGNYLMMRTIHFTLNAEQVTADVAPHQNLVEVLQNSFALFGARESCAQGLCGCCTVLVDGCAVSGCLTLAAFADGAMVTTVEGLAPDGKLTPVQEAFLECGAAQCGFCTPGFVLMAGELIKEHPDPDDDAIRHYLSGNLCRCGAYAEIIEAVKLAARRMRASAA